MSTRANIIIKDKYSKLYFYRHSDGYPEGTLPTLNKFLDLVKEGKIRDNVGQASGWLVAIGIIEYQTLNNELFPESHERSYNRDHEKVDSVLQSFHPDDWKVGSYEPTNGIHGDIQFLYVIDLEEKEIKVIPKTEWDQW